MLQDSWRDEMKERTRDAVQQSGGMSEITLDEMSEKLVHRGKTIIPATIEADLKNKIRQACFGK
jgi:hypothetical protein